MSASDNLQLVRDMYAALNAQDLDAHDTYWHDDMIWHGPPGFGDVHGLAAFKRDVMVPFYTAFPDYFAKNDIEFADDTWVAATGYLPVPTSVPTSDTPRRGGRCACASPTSGW